VQIIYIKSLVVVLYQLTEDEGDLLAMFHTLYLLLILDDFPSDLYKLLHNLRINVY